MAKRLDELPEELVSNISLRLHADDIAAFRLTSRALEHKSFHEFATEYFHEKCFMITTESLKVLVNIANSEKLNKYLHHVHFTTALFSEGAFGCPNGCNCAWQPSVKQKDAYRVYIKDQKDLSTTGRGKEMLLEAFSKLISLKILSFEDSSSALPPGVDYRGHNKVQRITGRGPQTGPNSPTDKEYETYVHHVWKMVIEALADSGMTTLTRLGTFLNKGYGYGLTISPDVALAGKPAMRKVLSSLEKLTLRLQTDFRKKTISDSARKEERAKLAMTMRKFARTLPALSALDLTLDSGSNSGLTFANLVLHMDLSNMKKLFLQSIYVNANPLCMALSKLSYVQDLRLEAINLTKGNWIPVLKTLQKMTDHLKHLHLMFLLEDQQKVYFLKRRDPKDPDDDDFDSDYDPDDDSDEDDSADETDEEMPPLEPLESTIIAAGTAGPQPKNPSIDTPTGAEDNAGATSTTLPPVVEQTLPSSQINTSTNTKTNGLGVPPVDYQIPSYMDSHTDPSDDHIAPTDPGSGERGYWVCLKDEQIGAQLPTFIEQYNLGEHIYDDDGMSPMPPLPGGMGGPNLNSLMNMVGAALGVPNPPGAATHAHGTPGNGNQNGGANGGANGDTHGGAHGGAPGGYAPFATSIGNGLVLGMGPLPFAGAPPPNALPVFGPPPPPPPPPPANGTTSNTGSGPFAPLFNFAHLNNGADDGWEDDDDGWGMD